MPPPEQLVRFTRSERLTHRTSAGLVLLLTATGLVLYVPSLALIVGRRPLVEAIHVAAGLLLPVPALVALLSPDYRRDLAALNRFQRHDWAWLHRRDRRVARLPIGKFNPGQKLAAAAFAAAGVVLFGTGLMLLLPTQLHLSNNLREGATLSHDLTTFVMASTLSATTRRWSAWVLMSRISRRSSPTTTSAPRWSSRRWRHPMWAVLFSRRRWWCTARVPTAVRSTAWCARHPGDMRTCRPVSSIPSADTVTAHSAGSLS